MKKALYFLRKNSVLFTVLFVIFFLSFSVYSIITQYLFYIASVSQVKKNLQEQVERIKEDVTYENGMWNMYKYNADPNLPESYPLYILATDGFVIDRWKPVRGLLDTSDFKHLSSYSKPQTITTPTNQSWRIFSKPIYNQNSDVLGVVTVSKFLPPDTDITDVDNTLLSQISVLSSKIQVHGDAIDTRTVDPREINYDVAFQVVDRFNKILAKSNNTNSIDQIPNFIDRSYVGDMLKAQAFREVKDEQTEEKFLIYTSPLTNNNAVTGVIVIGKSVAFIDTVMRDTGSRQLITSLVLSFLFAAALAWMARRFSNTVIGNKHISTRDIYMLSFNKATSTLTINNHEISIPFATNQYYLCQAIFTSPKKKWETDELLEKFGESIDGNWRKVYDAMIILNKKAASVVATKLVVAKDKTYQMNPALVSKIS